MSAAEAGFRTVREVVRYLAAQGYEAPESTVYDHKDSRLLRKTKGVFPEASVLRYAKRHLRRADTGEKVADREEEWSRRKRIAEAKEAEHKEEERRIKVERQKGRLIPKNRVGMELAARAQLLKSDFRNFVHGKAATLVEVAGGDGTRTADLIQALLAAGDEWLGRYAEKRTFMQAVVGDDEEFEP